MRCGLKNPVGKKLHPWTVCEARKKRYMSNVEKEEQLRVGGG